MKKLLSTILACAMLLMLASCAAAPSAGTSAAPSESAAAPSETASEAPAETPAEASETASVPAESASEPVDIKIAAFKGPTGMGMSKLMEDSANGETANNYTFDLYSAPDELTAKLITGEYDIAAIPTNLAAVLNKKTDGELKLLALNTLGVLYIMQKVPDGSDVQPITSLEELRGKTVYAIGQGSNPEYVLNFLLKNAGLEPGTDVTVEFFATADELMAKAVTGEVDYCMLPEPNVSTLATKNPDMKSVIDLTQVWNDSGTEGQLTMGSMVVTKAFAAAHPDAVASFLAEYQGSVDYVNQNMEDASELIAKYEIVPNAAIALKALPNCNIVCITGADIWTAIEGYYKVLFDAAPTSVGGAMPDESMVYEG